jgi:hypothetical protein
MRTYRGLLIATLVVMPWVAKYEHADAAAPTTCNGLPATVVGTNHADALSVNSADGLVAVGKAGNDTIYGPYDSDYWNFTYDAVACGWAGNDTFAGTFKFIDGGGGFDTATVEACSGTVIRNVEQVTLISCDGPNR